MSKNNARNKSGQGRPRSTSKLEADLQAAHEKLQAGQPEKAEGLLRKAISTHGREPRLMANLVASLQRMGRLEDAERAARASVAANPEHPATANNLGTVLKFQGRLDEAATEFRRATELDPNSVEALRHLMGLKTYEDPADPDLVAAEAMLDRLPPGDQGRVGLYFALGRGLDEVNEHARAFSCFERGNRLRRSLMKYQPRELELIVEETIRHFDAEQAALAPAAGASTERPVLVCGMPRSGSTLVEQILSSHPSVEGVGEVPALPRVIGQLNAPARERVAATAGLGEAGLVDLGERYAAELRGMAPNAEVIVDKFLTNFLQVGLLRRALPGARFIHVRRAPMDNGFGIFRTLFTSTIPYAYDIKEIASTYALTHRLCDPWEPVTPGTTLQVAYEDLGEDLEGTARRMVEFAGLPWDDACLAFHETERAVQTASATQVRQPIYASSVDRWRPYEAHLKPMARAFEAAGVPVEKAGTRDGKEGER